MKIVPELYEKEKKKNDQGIIQGIVFSAALTSSQWSRGWEVQYCESHTGTNLAQVGLLTGVAEWKLEKP